MYIPPAIIAEIYKHKLSVVFGDWTTILSPGLIPISKKNAQKHSHLEKKAFLVICVSLSKNRIKDSSGELSKPMDRIFRSALEE